MTPHQQHSGNSATKNNKVNTPNVELPIRIFVHTPADDIVSFPRICIDATVAELKCQLELRTGILAELQSLYMNNTRLEDNKTLREKRIKNGAVLRVKIKERSLQQIHLAASKGNTSDVFMLGVEYIEDDYNTPQLSSNDDGDDSITNSNNANSLDNQIKAWNTFVPLRAFQALFAACFAGHFPVVSKLLDNAAANISMVTKNRHSLLHVAAFNGRLNIVSYLLSKGADSKLLDLEGMTALSLAALNGHVKVEKHLWLFNWNMEIITGLDNTTALSEEEREALEMRETARKYRNQYKRVATKSQHELSLPTILTDQLNVMKTSYEDENFKLPNIQNQERLKERKRYKKEKINTNQFNRVSQDSGDRRKNHQQRTIANVTTLISDVNANKKVNIYRTTSPSKEKLLASAPPETKKATPIWSNGMPQLTKYKRSAYKPLIDINSTIKLKSNSQPQISLKNPKEEDATTRKSNGVVVVEKNPVEHNPSYSPGIKFHVEKKPERIDKKQTLVVFMNDGIVIPGRETRGKQKKEEEDKNAQPPRLAKVTVDSVDLQECTRPKHIIPTDRKQVRKLLGDSYPIRMPSKKNTFWRENRNTNSNGHLPNHQFNAVSSTEIPNYGTSFVVDEISPSNKNIDVFTSAVTMSPQMSNASLVSEETTPILQSITTTTGPSNPKTNNAAVDVAVSSNYQKIAASNDTAALPNSSVVPSQENNDSVVADVSNSQQEKSATITNLPTNSRTSNDSIVATKPITQQKSTSLNPAVTSIDNDFTNENTASLQKSLESPSTSKMIESSEKLDKETYHMHSLSESNSKENSNTVSCRDHHVHKHTKIGGSLDDSNQGRIVFVVEGHQSPEETSWRPSVSLQTDAVRVNGRFVKTYDEWLEEKDSLKAKKDVTVTDCEQKYVVRVSEGTDDSERQKAHEAWLVEKEKELKKQRSKTRSSLQTLRRMRTFSSHACTFEQWLEKKREDAPKRSTTPTPKSNLDRKPVRRERIKHGMTFEEWKKWKQRERDRKLKDIAMNYENSYNKLEKERREELNNRTYEQWINRKDRERRINIALQETLKEKRIEGQRIRKQQRLYDPHLKTFEEWLLEKDYDRKYEVTRQRGDSSERYPEDSEIIFDMWLANKFAHEMSVERSKLNKAKYGEEFGSTMSIVDENVTDDESNSDYDNDFDSESDEET